MLDKAERPVVPSKGKGAKKKPSAPGTGYKPVKRPTTGKQEEQKQENKENEKEGEGEAPQKSITEEEQEKTLKCLVKVMDYQLKSLRDQADHMNNKFDQIETALEEQEEKYKLEDFEFKRKLLEEQLRQQ